MKNSFSRFLLAPLMALIVAGLAAPVEAARKAVVVAVAAVAAAVALKPAVAVAPVPAVALKPAAAARQTRR